MTHLAFGGGVLIQLVKHDTTHLDLQHADGETPTHDEHQNCTMCINKFIVYVLTTWCAVCRNPPKRSQQDGSDTIHLHVSFVRF